MGLQQKKVEAMKLIGQIAKDAKNQQQGFSYLSDEAVTAKVQSVLSSVGIALTPPDVTDISCVSTVTAKGGPWHTVTVKVRMGLADTDTSETESGVIVGIGADSGDKAVYKALTGARKYFFRLIFGIGTGDDPDATSCEHAPAAHSNPAPKPEAPARDPLDADIERAFTDMMVPIPQRRPMFKKLSALYGTKEQTASRLIDMASAGTTYEALVEMIGGAT